MHHTTLYDTHKLLLSAYRCCVQCAACCLKLLRAPCYRCTTYDKICTYHLLFVVHNLLLTACYSLLATCDLSKSRVAGKLARPSVPITISISKLLDLYLPLCCFRLMQFMQTWWPDQGYMYVSLSHY